MLCCLKNKISPETKQRTISVVTTDKTNSSVEQALFYELLLEYVNSDDEFGLVYILNNKRNLIETNTLTNLLPFSKSIEITAIITTEINKKR
jgi:hypothetical protein